MAWKLMNMSVNRRLATSIKIEQPCQKTCCGKRRVVGICLDLYMWLILGGTDNRVGPKTWIPKWASEILEVFPVLIVPTRCYQRRILIIYLIYH